MELGPVFMKLRTTAFVSVFLVCLTWIVLLCVEIHSRWDVSDEAQRSLVVVMVLIDTITVIMLPILLLLEFRVWLDAVRMLFLLTAHFGAAIGFTAWNPKFRCPEDTPDDDGVCELVDMYILLGSWVVPALLMVYSAFLAVAVYTSRRSRGTTMSEKKSTTDTEAATPTQAVLPIMPPPRDRSTVSSIAHMYSNGRKSQPSWLQAPPPNSKPPPSAKGSEGDEFSEKDGSRRSSARLSKRIPERFF